MAGLGSAAVATDTALVSILRNACNKDGHIANSWEVWQTAAIQTQPDLPRRLRNLGCGRVALVKLKESHVPTHPLGACRWRPLGLYALIAAIALWGVMTTGFGIGFGTRLDGVRMFIFLPPMLMAVGALIGAVLFGLGRRWVWWVGAIAAGMALGVAGYWLWFMLITQVWCV